MFALNYSNLEHLHQLADMVDDLDGDAAGFASGYAFDCAEGKAKSSPQFSEMKDR
jgi:hypothetical protein